MASSLLAVCCTQMTIFLSIPCRSLKHCLSLSLGTALQGQHISLMSIFLSDTLTIILKSQIFDCFLSGLQVVAKKKIEVSMIDGKKGNQFIYCLTMTSYCP